MTNNSENSFPDGQEASKPKPAYKTWGFIAAAFIIIVNFASIRDALSPAIQYSVEQAGPVVLYGTEWCGYCSKARQMFDRHNIPYQDLDVETSDEANRQFKQLGGQGVPLITVGEKVVHGFDYGRIRSLLECDNCVASK